MPGPLIGPSMARSQSNSVAAVARSHALTGAAMGVGAAVLSYLLTYLLAVVDGLETSEQAAWKVVGLIWYSAHNVEIVGRASGFGGSVTDSANVVVNDGLLPVDIGTAVPALLYYVVPVLALVFGGYLTVRLAGDRLGSVGEGAVAGATVAIGATVVAILGRFLFEITVTWFGAQASAAPSLLPAVLLVGILYPVVFGGLGGAAAAAR